MTVEQKAKAYDESLERAKKWYYAPNADKIPTYSNRVIEEIFPELKKSEVEKIKEDLIQWINEFPDTIWRGHYKSDIIAWLEKQDEQKSADKFEPKFHEGDWVIYNNDICQIVKREEGCNKLVTQFGVEKEPVNERNLSTAKLWDISDAKDGDVLQLGIVTAIFQKYIGNNYKCYCSVYNGEFEIPSQDGDDNIYGCYNATPATKEQRDLLFQKMKEAGYEWVSQKKELRKGE